MDFNENLNPEEEQQAQQPEDAVFEEPIDAQEVIVEEIDTLTGMYLGRSYLFAPDGIDGMIHFQSINPLFPGQTVPLNNLMHRGYVPSLHRDHRWLLLLKRM
mgnify:CR=1 FL=1